MNIGMALRQSYLGNIGTPHWGYLRNYNDPIYSSVEEQGKVLQSGLALTPMAWAHARHTVDWAIAWALIGEWASQELFPPPRHGNWPKHGHDGNLMGLWRHLTPEEAAHPSPAGDWLARCNPDLSPDQAYCQYQEISREDRWAPFSFGNAWSTSHRDHPAIKRAICQMPIPKLERMVLIRFQGLHPPWVSTAEWEFLMWFALAVERDRSWSAAWQHTDPRHPGYNGARAKVTPEPVLVECSGLGGGDLQLAQPWHVCIKTNKHNQRIYGPSPP